MKLRTKILLSMAVLIICVTGASLFIVRSNVDAHVRQEIVGSFQSSALSLRDLQSRKDATSERAADLLVQTPILKAVMTTRDRPTIQDVSTELWTSSGSDLFAVVDQSGSLMALDNTGRGLPRDNVQEIFKNLRPNAFSWVVIDGRLYRVIAKSIRIGASSELNSLGILAIGFEVNEQFAVEVARVANAQIAFSYKNHIVATTLGKEHRKALESGPAITDRSGISESLIAGERFLVNSIPLDETDSVELSEFRSYDQETAFVREMNRLIILVGFVVIGLSGGFVFLISHTFTQPLNQLVTGVRALSSGDFAYPLQTSGRDEVAELTTSFDRMRTSLRENQQRMVASARMEAVGQLAGGVAHDFNNLITVIKGYADLLTMQMKPEDPMLKCAEQISKAGDRASALTRQLLAFSRKQVLQPQAIEANSVVTGLQKMLKVLVGERFEIVIATSPVLPRVMVDPGQLEQVILNLVVNARDAMADGGKIVIGTDSQQLTDLAVNNGLKPGRYVRVFVSDSGCGMDEETQRQIFQPFFTTKEVGKGTGLGLAIVYGVVKQTGGLVEVKSKLGEGSTFNIFLPELAQEVEGMQADAKKPTEFAATETILVVEDEEGVRNMVQDSLKVRGYKVLVAQDGEDALRVLKEYPEKVDLVLTDVVMAKLGGLDLAMRLQSSGHEARVLLMSGYTDRINEIEEAKLPLLRKPFGPDALVQAIRDTLAREKPGFARAPELASTPV